MNFRGITKELGGNKGFLRIFFFQKNILVLMESIKELTYYSVKREMHMGVCVCVYNRKFKIHNLNQCLKVKI